MPRILYYCDSLGWGGAEIYLQRLICKLDGRGFEVHLAVPRGNAYEQFVRCFEGHRVNLHAYEANRKAILPTFWQTWNVLRKVQPALVHFNLTSFDSCRYSIWAIRWFWHVPSVLTIHLLHPDALPQRWFGRTAVRNWLTRRAMQGFRRIIAVSKAVKGQLTGQFGVKAHAKIQVIYNAVDTGSFARDRALRLADRRRWGICDADFVVIMVARLEEKQKAQSIAIEALARMPNAPRRSVLLIVGGGPSWGMLEDRAHQLGVKDRVIFTGTLSNVDRAFNTADVAILPSRNEGFPFALLEAMASGVPVIASRVGGIPELVEDNISGLLIEPADVQQLTSSLCLLYRDEHLRDKLGREALHTVASRFSLSSMVASTLRAYISD